MSDDDLFARLFELFNQPGPVNLRLAAELARHLTGEREPIDPWAAEQFRELTRLAEYRMEQVAPFPVAPAPDVLPVDAREWAERSLTGLTYLAEPFAGLVDTGSAGPAGELLRPLGPAIIGMHLGTLVGSLGQWVMASFDAGVPIQGDGPVTYVVPTIDRFTRQHDLDPRNVRLWVAINETAHRALFRVPPTMEHLVDLLERFGGSVHLDPDRLSGMLEQWQSGGMDPAAMDEQALESLFAGEETREAQEALEAFLGLTAGYTRTLVGAAAGELLPDLDQLYGRRDADRSLGERAAASSLAATFVDAATIAKGEAFCAEVGRRYGAEALASIWTQPGRIPTAAETGDPVGWAARVLLEDLE